ncbi:ATP-binding protein [Paenibacillus sp. 1P07SE]|uniref:ATP-binding protein n=1 Tax=Paenibacillus sp. 1P07SE TaxID=3132209 RepID=UPI0039A5B327
MARIELQLTASLTEWERLGASIRGYCHTHAVPEESAGSVLLACEEWFVNIITHGCKEEPSAGPIRFTLELSGSGTTGPEGPGGPGLLAVFRDQGPPFDPLLHPDPELDLPAERRPLGGLGIWLIKRSMDELSYGRIDGCNVLRMYKASPAD